MQSKFRLLLFHPLTVILGRVAVLIGKDSGWNAGSRAWVWKYTFIHLDIKELFYADIGIDPG